MLAPMQSRTIEQTGLLLAALSGVTAWAKAISVASLPPQGKDSLPRYNDIDITLSLARAAASDWLVRVGPETFAHCLQCYISFNNIFAVTAPKIREILQTAGENGLSDDKRNELRAYIGLLLDEVRRQIEIIRQGRERISSFSTIMVGYSEKLSKLLTEVRAGTKTERAQVEKLKEKTATLREDLKVAESNIGHGQTGLALKGATLHYAFTVGLMVSAGVLSCSLLLTAAAVAYGFYDFNKSMATAHSKLREINKLAIDMKSSAFKLFMLDELETLLINLATHNRSSESSIKAVDMLWENLRDKLEIYHELLDQPAVDLARLGDFQSLEFAEKTWGAIAAEAATLQNQRIEITHSNVA